MFLAENGRENWGLSADIRTGKIPFPGENYEIYTLCVENAGAKIRKRKIPSFGGAVGKIGAF